MSIITAAMFTIMLIIIDNLNLDSVNVVSVIKTTLIIRSTNVKTIPSRIIDNNYEKVSVNS